jgi:hypothetical protein
LSAQTEDVLSTNPDILPKNRKERREERREKRMATETKQGPTRGQAIVKGFVRLARQGRIEKETI